MICSISSTKSALSWLERLRSSRGFPNVDGVDLDNFLTIQSSESVNNAAVNNSSSSNRNVPEKSIVESAYSASTQYQAAQSDSRGDRKDNQCRRCLASNILCDLFNMGDANEISRKKSSRKQARPKFSASCSPKNANEGSSDNLMREKSDNSLASSGDNSLNERVGLERENNMDSVLDLKDVDVDLRAYSRSEVTVIDTSLAEWKFQCLVYKSKNVWKVREKMRKNFGKKKRKTGVLDERDNEKKKLKVSDSVALC
ncbi:hypothetical protein Nepgr_021558 [Nepenthes gracilis]|uniref:Uncharacterized protein n=1 Tax=Nepenthes gracilis TaxID=150966 RepID=A0AAD3SYY1_NEPGR|nr:hypothetical protein Nepgr_021558 [Nepenthes gracilis]